MNLTIQQALFSYFLADRRRYGSIPALLVTWAIVAASLLVLFLGVRREAYVFAVICFAIGLALLALHFAYSYWAMRRQQSLRCRIYKQSYIPFGLPSLGGYGEEKQSRRALRRLLETRFVGNRLVWARLHGEASKVSLKDAKDFGQLLEGLVKDSSSVFVVGYGEVYMGTVSAHLVPRDSEEAVEARDRATLMSLLEAHASMFMSSASAYPAFEFKDWQVRAPHFSAVQITDLPDRPERDSMTERLLTSFEKNFPYPDRKWRVQYLGNGLRFEAHEASSVLLREEQDRDFFASLCGKISSSMKRGFWLGLEVQDLTYEGDSLSSLTLHFSDPQNLYDNGAAREFCGKLASVLAKKYGGSWRVRNGLAVNKTLSFRRA